jgi:hypothetical protein
MHGRLRGPLVSIAAWHSHGFVTLPSGRLRNEIAGSALKERVVAKAESRVPRVGALTEFSSCCRVRDQSVKPNRSEMSCHGHHSLRCPQNRLLASGTAQCHDIKNSDIRRIKARTRHSPLRLPIVIINSAPLLPLRRAAVIVPCSTMTAAGMRVPRGIACDKDSRSAKFARYRSITIMLAVSSGC